MAPRGRSSRSRSSPRSALANQLTKWQRTGRGPNSFLSSPIVQQAVVRAASRAASAAADATMNWASRSLSSYMRGSQKSPVRSRSLPSNMSPNTPGFFKKSGLKKSRSRAGASSSKSMGFFKRGTPKRGVLDYFSKNGVVYSREYAGVVSTNATDKAQTLLIGHSTHHWFIPVNDMCQALTKMLAIKLKRSIASFSDLASDGVGESMPIKIYHKEYIGASETSTTIITIINTTTWQQVANAFSNFFVTTWIGETGFHLTRLTAQSAAGILLLNLNLEYAKMDYYVKSALKMQNRTINSSGNDEEDDVDNVPLYGKSYDGTGNYFMHNNAIHATSDTSTNVPVITGGFSASSPLSEPNVISQFKNVKAVGKVHLDPGQIKTSVIYYRKKMNINTFLRNLVIAGQDLTTGATATVKLGKYRFFLVEKMIQAIATTDVNAPTLAYEIDNKVGVHVTAPIVRQTNYVIEHTPL